MSKTISTKLLIMLCVVSLCSGVAIATYASISSNVIHVVVVTPTWPQYGQITLTSNADTIATGQSVTLTATLNPAPSTAQTVTFYFTLVPNANDNTPIADNPNTGFYPIGGLPNANVLTTNGVAQIACPLGSTGTYYFKATVSSPT